MFKYWASQMPGSFLVAVILGIFFGQTSALSAEEIHLDCARANQGAMVDIDTSRNFMQLMWRDGVAEEFHEGESYLSGPDQHGRKEKVVYRMRVDSGKITFGVERICLESMDAKCESRHLDNHLDIALGEMRYNTGDSILILNCSPAPPGRRF